MNINLNSPLPYNFPEKVKMKSTTLDDIKYIMPPLDLNKTKKSFQINNSNINNSQNTKANSEEITINKKRNLENEEWLDVMKNVGLTEEEMERFLRNKFISKLINAIDILIGTILGKNKIITEISHEKSVLNSQIRIVKKDNMNLTKNYLELALKLKNLQDDDENKDKLNNSMVFIMFLILKENNTGRINFSRNTKEKNIKKINYNIYKNEDFQTEKNK